MFIDKVQQKLTETGWQGTKDPWNLADNWKTFVDICRKGYTLCIYEYDNDLSVRDALDVILSDTELQCYEGYIELKKRVAVIDIQFKQLLQDDILRSRNGGWWYNGILKYAGEEYVKDIRDLYGLEVQKV